MAEILNLDDYILVGNKSSQDSSIGAVLSFFKLKFIPFKDSVDPEIFFQTKQHADVLYRIRLSIENDVSLALVVGESGTGKTMLTEVVLSELKTDKVEAGLVLVSPGMSKTGVMREICRELGIVGDSKRGHYADLLNRFQEYVMRLDKEFGKKVLLVFDEVHFLTQAQNLQILRTLSNIETDKRKLVTCLLVGEPQIWKRLQRASYASIRNRLYQVMELKPLKVKDIEQYIKFRVTMAGGSNKLFTSKAIERIYEKTKGVCREVNKWCFNCLIEAYRLKMSYVDHMVVESVIQAEVKIK